MSTTFPQGTTADQVADITRIRVTVKRVADDSPIGLPFVTEVDPNLDVWVTDLEVEIPPDNPPVYLVTELISVLNGVETVEFSGVTAQFNLLGQTPVQEVEVVQGPVANNFVTSVTIQPAGPLAEGDGLQLQAQVVMSQPGAATLQWASASPGIASVTEGGFLQAHLPGTAQITATAGGESDDINIEVVARPIGLAFVSQPSAVEVDQAMDPAPSVEVVDARGDRVTSSTASITVALQDQAPAAPSAAQTPGEGENEGPQAAPLNGTTTVAAVGGLATFDNLLIPEGGLFRLIATSLGFNPAMSQDFEVMLLGADIVVSKEVDQPLALEGDEVTFTVTVRNDGPATATDVNVSDPLPAGLGLVSADASQGTYTPGTGRWDIGTLDNAEPVNASETLLGIN